MHNRAKGEINRHVGSRLREIRERKGMLVEEAARRAGIPAGSYTCLENGWYRVNLDNLFRMLFAVGGRIDQVWPKESKDVMERSA